MAFASADRHQQPPLARAKTALLPSHRGDAGDADERQPLLSRHATAPAGMSKAVRNRAILDRQLSRQVSWMVNIEAVHEDDEELGPDSPVPDEEANVNASKLGPVKEEGDYAIPDESTADVSKINKSKTSDLAKPGKPAFGPDKFGPDDFGPDEGLFRKPKFESNAMMPLIIIDVVIVVNVALLTMVAQPLLRQKWSSYASALLAAPEGSVCVGLVMLLLVNLFMFLSPGYSKVCEKAKGLDRVTILSISDAHGAGRWCKMCAAPKHERVHHCSQCNRCVMVMDHHCGILGNCVGHQNHRFWMAMVAYTGLFILHAQLVLMATIVSHWPGIRHVASIASAIGANLKTASFVVVFCFAGFDLMFLMQWYGFFRFHLKLILDNYTTIENLERDEGAKSAFDEGGRKNNVASFLFAQRNNQDKNRAAKREAEGKFCL